MMMMLGLKGKAPSLTYTVFQARGGGEVLPIVGYTGRLRPKLVPVLSL